jgi:hypothetical protein
MILAASICKLSILSAKYSLEYYPIQHQHTQVLVLFMKSRLSAMSFYLK